MLCTCGDVALLASPSTGAATTSPSRRGPTTGPCEHGSRAESTASTTTARASRVRAAGTTGRSARRERPPRPPSDGDRHRRPSWPTSSASAPTDGSPSRATRSSRTPSSPTSLDALDDDLDRLEHELGAVPADNGFEGRHTVRIYNLLAHGQLYEQIPVHPSRAAGRRGRARPRAASSRRCRRSPSTPARRAQPIHADDQLIPIPKPHPPTVCNTMWALTDFTEANGATRIIPGSHLRRPLARATAPTTTRSRPRCRRAACSSGTAACGTAAAPTAPSDRRIGIAMNYCAGYIRQQENQQLGIPRRRGPRASRRGCASCAATASTTGSSATSTSSDPADVVLGPAAGATGPTGMVWDGVLSRRTPLAGHRRLAGPATPPRRSSDRDGGVLAAHGDQDRPFPLASVTKLLTALAVLVAVEEGTRRPRPAGRARRARPCATSSPTRRASASTAACSSPPGRRRIYSNAGFEAAGRRPSRPRPGSPSPPTSPRPCSSRSGMAATTLDGSPAHGATSTAADLARFAAELLRPDPDRPRDASRPRPRSPFPGLDGRACRASAGRTRTTGASASRSGPRRRPHWTAPGNDPATFGHFGRSGTFLWVDPVAGLALRRH